MTIGPVEFFSLGDESQFPVYWRLYEEVRQAILNGRLAPGTLLPSTRALAETLGIGRTTAVNAYELLLDEGYLETKPGSGVFVARSLPDDLLQSRAAPSPELVGAQPRPGLSRRGEALTAVLEPSGGIPGRPFEVGLPALDHELLKTWFSLAVRRSRNVSRDLLGASVPGGYWPLREAIAAYLSAARSVRCLPEQVFVMSGVMETFDLVARLFLDPGDSMWIEEPGFPPAQGTFAGAGVNLVPVPVDEDGIDVAAGRRICPVARLAFVTPSHQYPLGMTMSLARRLALLDWAAQTAAWILEDDHDGEFRYGGRPLPSLQGLDQAGRVLYLGSFSKVLFPNLRIGYLVVPPALVDTLARVPILADLQPPTLDQAVLAEFISDGHFVRHIRRVRSMYAKRQAALIEAVNQELGGLLEIETRPSGMHLVGWFSGDVDERAVERAAAERGIDVTPFGNCCLASPPAGRRGLVLGHAGFSPDQIREAAGSLAAAIRTVAR
jgi:GntR family transcriptional regulator/MocR family aminotransferase